MAWWLIVLIVFGVVLLVVAAYDLIQTKHAILRNFPIVGHFRYMLEKVGPELRQYIVADNDEERPFNRDQRRYVYASAKNENTYYGFGTDNKIETTPDYVLIRHSAFPHTPAGHDDRFPIPAAKVLGEWRGRPHAFRPESIVNVSAMSFGSLSGPAVEALNRGCAIAGALHNTGEGGIAEHHQHGGELIYQVGTGYFGCRNKDGSFSMDGLLETVAKAPTRAIEIKLSQGAKPGLGGVLPGAKVTAEIARVRGVEQGKTVASPSSHRSFGDVAGMVDFIETIAAETGLPVGIKSAVGQQAFWTELAAHMADTGRGPDYISVDGGEGGTGAAPMVFTDHVALPFRLAMAQVYKSFAEVDMHERVMFAGAGKLGFAQEALAAMTLGADLVMVAREPMMAIGCIQAQRCHTGHCPTGVATQQKWLARGLDPTDKGARAGNYLIALRHDLLKLSWACGVAHPALVPGEAVDLLVSPDRTESIEHRYQYDPAWQEISLDDAQGLESLM